MRKANDINAFLASLAKVLTLYLPVDGKAGATFEEWTDGATLAKSLNTNRSPKDFFFPQSECLMAFKREGKNIEIIDTRREHEDFAVFGVRACDARSVRRSRQRLPRRADRHLSTRTAASTGSS